MAVAKFTQAGVEDGPRNFGPPKRATLRHWYREATKQLKAAPKWEPHFEGYADVSEGAIIFTAPSWTLWISRQQYLRS